jgi:hypothetical protein
MHELLHTTPPQLGKEQRVQTDAQKRKGNKAHRTPKLGAGRAGQQTLLPLVLRPLALLPLACSTAAASSSAKGP